MRFFRSNYAAVTATLALIVALSGTSYAAPIRSKVAGLITGKQIKNGSVTGKDIRDHSLRAGDFKPGELPRGAQGPKGDPGALGARGPKGDSGATGDQGPKGEKGDACLSTDPACVAAAG